MIAKERKTTPEAVSMLFKSRGFKRLFWHICELPECQKRFQSTRQKHKCCCRKHLKRLSTRRDLGLHVSILPCAIPECTNTVVYVHPEKKPTLMPLRKGAGKRFCCEKHSNLAHTRRKTGWYRRLLDRKVKCMVPNCRERLILDEHHEEFSYRSNKASRKHYLCPTHHMAIHRGFAEIRSGKFVDLVPNILAAIRHKSHLFDGYVESLDPSRG